MSEPLGHHETLFDLEPAETPIKPETSAEPVTADFDEQGAFDIGIPIPAPFGEPDVDDAAAAEAQEANDEVFETAVHAPRKHPNKVSFYQDPEDTARLRGAVLHTMVAEGHRTLSQFVIRAVMKEVQRLEEKYNDGEPFPAVSANEMPQGRPQG